jgi:hypothetical protein
MDHHPMINAIDKMFDSILTPADAQKHREQQAKRDAKERVLRERVRNESAAAIACLADAVRYPYSAQIDLQYALKNVTAALQAARELDHQEKA